VRRFVFAVFVSCDTCGSQPAQDAAPIAVVEASTAPKAETILAQNCFICHTQDMIDSQRLTRTQWEKELKKMSNWGAQVTDSDQPILLDYLSARADAGEYAPASMTFDDLAASIARAPGESNGDAARGKTKYEQLCQSCHGENARGAQGFGARLASRPIVWRRADFEKAVKEGQNRMPPQAASVDDAAISDLLAYLRSL